MSTPHSLPSSDDHEGYYCPPVHQDPVASRKDQPNKDNGKSDPWFFSSLFSTLKARRHDIHCSIDEKLKQLQVTDGSLDHIWKVGKHRLLSHAGSLEESRDYQYEGKLRAATKSKSLLQQMESELVQVMGSASLMMGHFDALLDLFEKFRHVNNDSSIEQLEGKGLDPPLGDGTSVTRGYDVTDTLSLSQEDDYYGVRQSAEGQRKYTTAEEIQLVNIRKSFHDLTNVFKEALNGTCISIASTARTELNDTQSATIGRVMKAKCDFDLLRHKIMKSGALPMNKGTDGVAYPYHIPSPELGFSQIGEGDSSFILVNSPSSASPQPSMASSVSEYSRNELVEANQAYNSEVSTAKEQLNFILEQTAMSTMSCYNVFFSQMASFFQSAQENSTCIAKVIVQLKNSQVIARKLTQERKEMMMHNATRGLKESGDLRKLSDAPGNKAPVQSSLMGGTTTTTTTHPPSEDIIPYIRYPNAAVRDEGSSQGMGVGSISTTSNRSCTTTVYQSATMGDLSGDEVSVSTNTDDGDLDNKGILDILFS